MTLFQSALGLIATLTVIFFCSRADKKSGVDNHRLIISIIGMVSMTCLFFLLANILIAIGVLK